ncbi:germin-like protein subfamily 3 member 2 [Gastrolobium bilobum]|uniref:germin-like protein subfamily 3 member 2 n=1 Tax=Gastrolobium bilobum TaxID=150636 RepID=UPI002AB29F71|nr:germin-like protein subfamily 3 member 2 [Gastrolobium bilobum]
MFLIKTLWLLCAIFSLNVAITLASDPDPVQDFCIPNPRFGSIRTTHGMVTILPCKNSSEATIDDFVFHGMKVAGNFSDTGLAVIAASPTNFPGLNTLGMSFARADIEVGGINPPHFHPRATELVHVIQGKVYSGFVDSSNRVFARILEQGEIMVFPRGLVHFLMNVGDEPVTLFGSFNSQNPGIQKIPSAVFGSGIDEELLEKAFGLSSKQIGTMRKKFDPKTAR